MKKFLIFPMPQQILIGLVFLLPLLWVPFTADVLEFNKQAILLVAAPLLLFLWLLKSVREKEISFSLTAQILASIVFVVILGGAALLSQDRWRSIIGFGAESHESFATILAVAIIAFSAVTILKEKSILLKILSSFSVSAGLVAIIALVAAFGGLQGLSFPPGFNTIGTLSGFTVFLAAAFLVSFGLIHITRGVIRAILLLVLITQFIALFILGTAIGWLLVAVGAAVYFVTLLRNNPDVVPSIPWWFSPPLIVGLALAFMILQPRSIVRITNIPPEISPSNSASAYIAAQTLKERPLLGSGPGTWIYDYSKFRRPQPINSTSFWNLRFAEGSSKILSMLATHGMLGWLSWIGVLGVVLLCIIRTLRRATPSFSPAASGALTLWITLGVAQFVTTSNITLDFLFWLATAAVIAHIDSSVLHFSLPKASARAAVVGMGASFVAVLLLVSLYGVGTRYVAAIQYTRGIRDIQNNDIEGAIAAISRSATFDSQNDLYWRSLSDVWLLRLSQHIQQSQQKSDINQEIETAVNSMLQAATRATIIAPHNVANWTQLAVERTNLIPLGSPAAIPQIVEPAIASWQKAQELEPSNPFLPTQRAIVYLNAADIVQNVGEQAKSQREQYLTQAAAALEEALKLKADYAPAHFQRALLAMRQGKTQEAISDLEIAQKLQPQDITIAAQLGVLYFNAGRLAGAESLLAAVLKAAQATGQDHANARYFLGLIADQQGEKEVAKQHFERILELNPGNVLIEKILTNLRDQKPALEGLESAPGLVPAVAVSEDES